MKTIKIISVSLVLITGMMGCSVGDPNMSDAQRTKTEGALSGALGGAILGAILGDSTEDTLKGAAIGGLAGYAYGTHVAKQKAKYAKEEDWLDACVASARKVNNETKSYNARVSREITKTKRLVRLYKQEKISKSQLIAQKKSIEKERKLAQDQLEKAKFELENQEEVLAQAKKSANEAAKIAKAQAVKATKKPAQRVIVKKPVKKSVVNIASKRSIKRIEREILVLKKQIKELQNNTNQLASVSALAAV